jgi:hypothetical protein
MTFFTSRLTLLRIDRVTCTTTCKHSTHDVWFVDGFLFLCSSMKNEHEHRRSIDVHTFDEHAHVSCCLPFESNDCSSVDTFLDIMPTNVHDHMCRTCAIQICNDASSLYMFFCTFLFYLSACACVCVHSKEIKMRKTEDTNIFTFTIVYSERRFSIQLACDFFSFRLSHLLVFVSSDQNSFCTTFGSVNGAFICDRGR